VNINPEYEQKNAKVIQYIRDKMQQGGDLNILLKGESLSGKSWIANEIFNLLSGVKQKITANEICSKFEYYKFSNYSDSTENLNRLYKLRFVPTLIVDDIGNEFGLGKGAVNYLKSFMEDRLDFIGRNRTLNVEFPQRIVTVFTTDLNSSKEIAERYGSKVGKGIPVKMQVLQIKGVPVSFEVIGS